MPNLDQSAWFFPQLGYRDTYVAAGIGDGTDYPGIGMNMSQVSIADSILTFTQEENTQTYQGGANQNGPATLPLIGGTMFWNKMQLLYGTVEVRGKLGGTGSHTTFWLFDAAVRPSLYQSNPSALAYVAQEVDIAEAMPAIYGDTTTIRQNVLSVTGEPNSVNTTTVTDYSQDFHTYKVVWTPTSVTFFVDGVQTNQVTTIVPNRPLIFVVDVEQTDSGSGPTDPANFPQTVQIDYVKAWDQDNNLIFSDDFDGAPAFQENNMSTLTFLQANGANSTAAANSYSLAYTNSTTSLSLLLAFIHADTSLVPTSVTDSLGNTWTNVYIDPRTLSDSIWMCSPNKAGGGANTVTAHFGSNFSYVNVILMEYANQAASPFDKAVVSVDSTGTSWTGTPVTPTQTNETIITVGFNGATTVDTYTPGAGFTTRLSTENPASFGRGYMMDSPQSGVQTITPTVEISASVRLILNSIAIKSSTSQPAATSGSWTQSFRDFVNKRGVRG